MIVGMCDRFKALPGEGGVLDQDVSLVRYLKIVSMGGTGEAGLQGA